MNLTPSKLIRRTHMYLALFLTPWMIIYALSGLVLNHGQAVRGLYGGNFPQFEKIGEREYTAAFSADADPRMIGAQILDHLDLAGTFNVQGRADQPRLVINATPRRHASHHVSPQRKPPLIENSSLSRRAVLNRAHSGTASSSRFGVVELGRVRGFGRRRDAVLAASGL